MTLFSISWRFDSIPNIGTENRVESNRVDSKIIGTKSGFRSIPNVGIVGWGRFQKLESKLDSTINLLMNKIDNIFAKSKERVALLYKLF